MAELKRLEERDAKAKERRTPRLAVRLQSKGVEASKNVAGSSQGMFDILAPDAEALEKVIGWAKDLASDKDQAAAVAARLQKEPGAAALVLESLAGGQRGRSDSLDDRDSQAFHHLLQMNFGKRARKSWLTKSMISQLATDRDSLDALATMSRSQIEQVPLEQNTENADFVRYFRGLHKSKDTSVAATQSKVGRKALILTCSFGEGHHSAADAVSSYLQDGGYHVETLDTSTHPSFPQGYWSSLLGVKEKDIFNQIVLQDKFYKTWNKIEDIRDMVTGTIHKPCPAPSCDSEFKGAMRAAFLEAHPDLIVTVYHMDLLPVLEVAKELGNLPVMHLATDLDTKMVEVFGEHQPSYPRFLVGMPFDVTDSAETVAPLDSEKQTFLSGYPVRPAFLRPYPEPDRISKLRAELAPPNTKVLLVMTGGNGQNVDWPASLATSQSGFGSETSDGVFSLMEMSQQVADPVHIVMVVGRNQDLAKKMQQQLTRRVRFPGGREVLGGEGNVTVEIAHNEDAYADANASYYLSADRIAELMDIVDVVVTKPGGGSTAEVAYRGVPAVFDATAGMLRWEAFNVKVFEEQSRGKRFSTAAELPSVVAQAMALGRSTRIADEPGKPGQIIDTGVHVRAAADKLLATKCLGCQVFSEPW